MRLNTMRLNTMRLNTMRLNTMRLNTMRAKRRGTILRTAGMLLPNSPLSTSRQSFSTKPTPASNGAPKARSLANSSQRRSPTSHPAQCASACCRRSTPC
jgi:hypothetical protein